MPPLRSLPMSYIMQRLTTQVKKKKKKTLKAIAEIKHNVAQLPLREAWHLSMANSNFSDASLNPNEP